ncbi:MAG: DUF2062 domain-containing protein [Flavobacterium sp.]|nr:DUF2062 domain-containing protein [Candidatus Neoflavobacterium equi]
MHPDICVIIPTYNNPKTLERIILGVLEYTKNIIVVDDGSGQVTKTILSKFDTLEILTFEANQGKGKALQAGFRKAQSMGYAHAITIDSDGQHFPQDLPVFFDEIQKSTAPVLLIGSRNMDQKHIPKKSSFGNKFSNFWFKFETGISLSDTQSGYRSYPLASLPNHFYTSKFEFEIEIIVRMAWRGVVVKNIPINVLYDMDERVSHFRPFRDFTRISIVNTVLVLILFLYIKPRDLYRTFQKKSFSKFVKEDLLSLSDTPEKKAWSMALGTFIGIAPFWGFQSFLAITLAMTFRLNKALSFTCSNISIPPMIPILILGSLQLGGYLLSVDVSLPEIKSITLEVIKTHLLTYVVGSFSLAIISATVVGLTALLFFKTSLKNTNH